MAIRNRSTRIDYVNEVNAQGTATQTELDNAFQSHVLTYHQGASQGVDGYYFDVARNAWLSNQTFLANYYDITTRAKNRYMYIFETIRANYAPYSVFGADEYVLVGYEFMNNGVVSGDIISLHYNGVSQYDINISNADKQILNNLNVVFPGTVKIAPFINGVSLNIPVLTLAFKKKVVV